ncbi:type 1 glutamine amidotransferase domain-containing protein [Erythrobacter sp. EC-HK427]|uniref:type 1 glutamine amidotransferase domain-containing protein n=1 Tax=Erythrobacter sp. EC-HK427 TaxID=2038396 RepID=UPI001259E7DC|nr:type 1 glutamine amidotransferase domain-containing protein [Erythrobacter sp. EC-HK427]VVT05555.1 conserved exported hypothetical protein [Erythrobacter sp. EC-HK427]
MIRWITIFCAFLLTAATAQAQNQPPAAPLPDRVLLVVSSHGRGGGDVQPGFEMDELAQAWLVFTANGMHVDIASPEGGAVVADAFDANKPYNAAFAADAEASAALADTLRLDPAMRGQYAAIMVIGGKGAMFDLPFSQVLQQLLIDTETSGGVIAAVCHGPAVLTQMRNADGSPWLSGRSLTGFTDEEEALFGERWAPQFPFFVESEAESLGARFSEAPMMLPFVVTDGRLVTGQNPYSVAAAADATLRALSREPAARTPWVDEHSLQLVSQAIGGDPAGLADALQRQDGSVDVPLVAIWGYYRAVEANGDPALLAPALRVMELALPYFPEPQLEAAIAEARTALSAR